MRVTQKMWQTSLLGNINRAYDRMASIDMRRRITTASDDPAGTEHMLRLRALLGANEQYQANVSSASRWLTYSESAVAGAAQDIRAAHDLALTAADSSNDLDGLAESLDNLIDDLLNQANAQQGGRYLFAGSQGRQAPFVREGNTVTYRGDDVELGTAISSGLSLRYNLPGSAVFGEQAAGFGGSTDWDPVTNWTTPVDQFFDGAGLELGRVRLTDGAGQVAVVDLRGAPDLAEVRQRIQGALPSLRVSIVDGERLEIRDDLHPDGQVRIEDVQGDRTAAILGLVGGSGGALRSRDLDPAFTDATPLSQLRGVTLPLGRLAVSVNGAEPPSTVDLSGALTVGDLRGLLNAVSGVSVSIADSGNRLNVSGVGPVSVAIRAVKDDATAKMLGLAGSAVPIRPFGTLLDLREAVANGDRARVRELLPELEALEEHFTAARGTLGNRLNLAEDAQSTLETRNYNMTAALSEVGDADMTEALIQYQSAESVYQASLLMASNIFQLTLSNYL
jgi:flagellin-like hook-associated protein FlgL